MQEMDADSQRESVDEDRDGRGRDKIGLRKFIFVYALNRYASNRS